MPEMQKFAGESVWGDYYKADEVDKLLDGSVERENEALRREVAQLKADVAFLAPRARKCNPGLGEDNRSWGISSNWILGVAYSTGGVGGRKQGAQELPSDKWDLDACERLVRLLPAHRRTPEVEKALDRARAALEAK